MVRKSLEAGGTIDLTSSEDGGNGCGGGDRSSLKVESGATLQNTGTINVEPGIGGERTIEGALENERFVDLSDGVKLNAGTFTQGKNGTLIVPIASTSSYGQLAVTGVASLGGTLDLAPTGGFKGELGQKFTVISDSSHENAVHPRGERGDHVEPLVQTGLLANNVVRARSCRRDTARKAAGERIETDGQRYRQTGRHARRPARHLERRSVRIQLPVAALHGSGHRMQSGRGAYFRDYLLTGADAGHR